MTTKSRNTAIKYGAPRPMETAPRDGTRFLCVTAQGHVSVGFYIARGVAFAMDSMGSGNTTPAGWWPLPTVEAV